jgi:hypothetical protein
VFGGVDLDQNALTTAEVFDPSAAAGHRWSSLPALPVARGSGGAALGTDGKIYVVAGRGSASSPQPVAETDVFTPGSSTPWSQGVSLPDPRYASAAVAAGADGRIYVVGGSTLDGQHSLVDAYQPASGTWAVVTALPVGLSDLAAAVTADGHFYAVGGDVENGPLPGAVEALPTSQALAPVSTFTVLSYAGPPLPPGVGPGGSGPGGSGSGGTGPGGGGGPVQLTAVTDITRLVAVRYVGLYRHKGGWQQVLALANAGATALPGPLVVVVDRHDKGSKLRGRAGQTRAHRPLGSPYVLVAPPGDDVFSLGDSVPVVLQFSGTRPRFTLRVLAGPGTV